MSAQDVVAWWDARARDEQARRFIHPLGVFPDGAAYEQSGRELAVELIELLGDVELVVDFGAGDGRVAIPLAERYRVIAVDASASMLERLRTRAPQITTVLADGLRPLPVEHVDGIVVLAVLIHHRHADAAVILGNLARALAPGGQLIVDLPIGDESIEPDGPISVARWTLPELTDVAEACGLEVEDAAIDGALFNVFRRP